MEKTHRRTLLTGLFIALPLLVTVWIVQLVFSALDKAVTPLVLEIIRLLGLGRWIELAWVDYLAPLVSVSLAFLFFYLLGLIGGNVIGKQVLKALDRFMLQLPFVRGIYSATRQFLDTFSNSDKRAFREVVLVEYPRKDLWTMAFVTNRTGGEVRQRVGEEIISLFIPTTPNPTSGWLLFVHADDVIHLEMSVDDAFKMIVSGGVLTPTYVPQPTDIPSTVADPEG